MNATTHTFSDGEIVYSVPALWRACADNPAVSFDIGFFAGSLSEPCWDDQAEGRPVSPAEVLDYPDFYPDHWHRIRAADTSYPILVAADRGCVIDGMHRLCRLLLGGATQVEAHLVKNAHLEQAAV